MKFANVLIAATAFLAIGGSAMAQDYGPPPPPPGSNATAQDQDDGPPPPPSSGDPYGYYSQYDHDGYYDREGHYRHFQEAPPPPSDSYYEEGRYERQCHRGNQAAGTIFGAIAGGVLGSALSHGHGGAVVGGAVLGGMLGNTIGRDIDCDDQPYAFRAYATGLNGDIGYRSEWRHGDTYGTFTPTREFHRDHYVCRDFTETTYSHGRTFTHTGTACRHADGNWAFD